MVYCSLCTAPHTSLAGSGGCGLCVGYNDLVGSEFDNDANREGYVMVNGECQACGGALKGETQVPTHSHQYLSASPGLDCGDSGTSLSSAPLREGYWRASADSRIILKCPNAQSCRAQAGPMVQCAERHTGPMCAVRKPSVERLCLLLLMMLGV